MPHGLSPSNLSCLQLRRRMLPEIRAVSRQIRCEEADRRPGVDTLQGGVLAGFRLPTFLRAANTCSTRSMQARTSPTSPPCPHLRAGRKHPRHASPKGPIPLLQRPSGRKAGRAYSRCWMVAVLAGDRDGRFSGIFAFRSRACPGRASGSEAGPDSGLTDVMHEKWQFWYVQKLSQVLIPGRKYDHIRPRAALDGGRWSK